MDSEELEELSACYHLPTDDPLVKEFYGMDEKDKIKSIVLGVDLLKHGRNRLITFEGDEIINNLKKENDNLLNKLAENKLENQKYIETSNERQKNLIRDIKLAEEIRFKTEIEQTEKINAGLNEKLSNIHERLDEQYEKKLKNAVSIYKEQSICEKNRIKELEENFKSIHQELDIKNNQKITDTRNFYENKLSALQDKYDTAISRGQNSSFKGQDGEDFVHGKLNMLFPKAEIEDTHNEPHRGDFIMRENIGKLEMIMMIETKNYKNNVQKSEIDKFYRDIDNPANNDIQCAVLISLTCGICSKEDFQFESRNGRPILFIHNLNKNFDKLKLAVLMFKAIIQDESIDLNNKAIIDRFKTLGSVIKRNFKNQKTKLDKFYSEQNELIAGQQENIIELYTNMKVKY
tara:strand:+ start:1114 stop:2325 length:1212 start_codon:yes stop_codon:yes gene_type:complete